MSAVMEEEIKRWTARRKAALVLEIIQGKTTVAEASRSFRKLPRQVDSSKPEFRRRAIARDSAPVAGFPARRAA